MSFFEQLQIQTAGEQHYLMSSPLIQACLNRQISLPDYIAFLSEAYYHVRHTVPLLMATGSKIPFKQEWLRRAIGEYIEEETGHEEWILNDIAASGGNRETVSKGQPSSPTEMMVAYAYYTIDHINPLGFFGMVHVLEGTSVKIADTAATLIQQELDLPDNAFTYLRSHGSLDQEHVKFFEDLMNKIDDPDDQACIIHSAKRFYQLYADIFRCIGANSLSIEA